MGFHLMVFSKEVAPSTKSEFTTWFEQETDWNSDLDYNDPDNAVPELRNWFMEIIKLFPPMNGSLASEDVDDDHVTDYSIGRNSVYMAFAWSVAEDAYETVLALAQKHGIGFYNPSSNEGEVIR
ncbi:MAG TPA: hypothetical protein VFO93_13605 [Hymenobacter sp.]|uniref:hypothetical protein n=1 Tax=Hymenobacter sp. TaxID=1898978 RepID=UPI002D7E3634|nr:hypothetical protein [Hymenobacter sp.]HET9504571.1 hypothetical protein [Hymenobacter sp.]